MARRRTTRQRRVKQTTRTAKRRTTGAWASKHRGETGSFGFGSPYPLLNLGTGPIVSARATEDVFSDAADSFPLAGMPGTGALYPWD